MKVIVAIAAATALFAGGPAAAATKAKYDCKGGTVLTVSFKDNKARVSVPGAEPVMLTQAVSGRRLPLHQEEVQPARSRQQGHLGHRPRQAADLPGALGSRAFPALTLSLSKG